MLSNTSTSPTMNGPMFVYGMGGVLSARLCTGEIRRYDASEADTPAQPEDQGTPPNPGAGAPTEDGTATPPNPGAGVPPDPGAAA